SGGTMKLKRFPAGAVAPILGPEPRPQWLLDAYADPAGFWTSKASKLSDIAPGTCRSALFQWYSLFDEFGARHVSGTRPAFTEHSQSTGIRSASYASIVTQATMISTHWNCVRKTAHATVV